MKDIMEGYKKMLGGMFALLVLSPGLYLAVAEITVIAKGLFEMVKFIWN